MVAALPGVLNAWGTVSRANENRCLFNDYNADAGAYRSINKPTAQPPEQGEGNYGIALMAETYADDGFTKLQQVYFTQAGGLEHNPGTLGTVTYRNGECLTAFASEAAAQAVSSWAFLSTNPQPVTREGKRVFGYVWKLSPASAAPSGASITDADWPWKITPTKALAATTTRTWAFVYVLVPISGIFALLCFLVLAWGQTKSPGERQGNGPGG